MQVAIVGLSSQKPLPPLARLLQIQLYSSTSSALVPTLNHSDIGWRGNVWVPSDQRGCWGHGRRPPR